MLTSANNAAWIVYFALSRYWTALVPSCSAALLAGALATMLARRGRAQARPAARISVWVTLLVAAGLAAGSAGLGAALTGAFAFQAAPSLWTAYRTARPSGISPGTWTLILGELSCWTLFGIHSADPRLIALGITGITASTLMLARMPCRRAVLRPGARVEPSVRRHERAR